MRRILTAALLAAPLLLAAPSTASANNGPCSYGYGCGAFCLNLFPRMHQHGPLFNYGPYYGYPPFDPYGAWDAYLRYHPQDAAYGKAEKVKHGNPHPLFHGGLFHKGCKDGGKSHGAGGCASCGGGHHAAAPQTGQPYTAGYTPQYQGNPYSGYAGYNPYSAAYYGPYMTTPQPATPAGYGR